MEAEIINRGRGPEIAGTRITVYDVLDYYKEGWHRDRIASLFRISSRQVDAAIRYIEEHRDEVMEAYGRILARHARATPPSFRPSSTRGMSVSWPWSGNAAPPRSGRRTDAGHSGGH